MKKSSFTPSRFLPKFSFAVRLCLAAMLCIIPSALDAQTITKANNTEDLNTAGSWVSGGPPGSGDTALWNNTLTAGGTANIGGDLSWLGIQLTNPGAGTYTIGATGSSVLTLGAGGINMSAATRDMIINAFVALGADQAWNINASRTLTVNGLVSGSGKLTKQGAGTVTLTNASNSFTGQTVIENGTISIGSLSMLGAPTTAATRTIVLGTASTTGNLVYTGSGTDAVTNRTIDLQGDGRFAITFPTNNNAVNVQMDVSSSVAGTKTFTLDIGGGSGDRTFGGNISNGVVGSVINLVKSGSRSLILTGNVTHTGTTWLQNGITTIGSGFAVNDTAGLILGNGTQLGILEGTSALTINIPVELRGNARFAGGGWTVNGNINLTENATRTVTFGTNTSASAGTANLIAGDISQSAGSLNIEIQQGAPSEATLDTSKWTFNGSNTFTGSMIATRGTIIFSQAQNLGSGSLFVLGSSGASGSGNWGGLEYTGSGNSTLSQAISLNSTLTGGGGRIDNQGAGTLVFNGNVTAAGDGANKTFILAGTNTGNNTINGVISNNGGDPTNSIQLRKEGGGKWVLSGNNTYTGATAVNAGTLLINGNQSASTGAVTVAAGATLGGSGTVGGATTISGNLSPGTSPGVLSFSSSLTLNSTATTTFEINGATRGTEYDGINILNNSALTYGGALVLNFGTTFGAGTHNFDLFSFTGTQTGSFSTVTLTGAYTGSLSNTGGIWSFVDGDDSFTFFQSTGELTFGVIPEPSTALLIVMGLGAVLLRRKCRS